MTENRLRMVMVPAVHVHNDVIEYRQIGLDGIRHTLEIELVAERLPSDSGLICGIGFMRGYRESCRWNDVHGYRYPNTADRMCARLMLDEIVAEIEPR